MVTSTTGQHIAICVRNTWLQVFVCFPRKNITAPGTVEKVNSAIVGFNEKTVCFAKGGIVSMCMKKYSDAFPMLADAGGYEIVRTGE